MWYPLLIAGIAATCMAAGRREKPQPWPGSPRTSRAGAPYLWAHELSRKNKPASSRIGITAPTPAQFRLERERFTHRLTKWLGFCQEFQSGSADFDDRVYILSDQKFAHRMLQGNRELQHHILQAFTLGVGAIYGTRSHLVAELVEKPATPPEDKVDDILKALHALKAAGAHAKPAAPLLPGAPLARLYFQHLPLTLFFAFAATLAGTQLLGYQMLEWNPIWPLLQEALLLYALSHLLLLRAAYGRSAHGHSAFLRFTLAGLPLGALYLFFALWFINCHYDTAPAQLREAAIQEMHVSRSGKSGKRYVLRVPGWSGQGGAIGITVSSVLYSRVQPGDIVRIHSHPGFLGAAWVGRVEAL